MLRQLSFFSTPSDLEALAPTGEVLFRNGSRRYRADEAGRPRELGPASLSGPRAAFWNGGRWEIGIGRTLFAAAPLSTGRDEAGEGLPAGYALAQNYPNPFNPVTTIAFTLPEAGAVSLRLYDGMGREVAVLADGRLAAGTHQVDFDASHLASGLYFYRLSAGGTRLTRSMLLQK